MRERERRRKGKGGEEEGREEEEEGRGIVVPFNMACLVVDDAKCVPGMGRGAHPARTSEATPRGRGRKGKTTRQTTSLTFHPRRQRRRMPRCIIVATSPCGGDDSGYIVDAASAQHS